LSKEVIARLDLIWMKDGTLLSGSGGESEADIVVSEESAK
jgi:hypothetical protein